MTSENLEYVLDSIYREGQRSDQHEKISNCVQPISNETNNNNRNSCRIGEKYQKSIYDSIQESTTSKKKNHMLFGTQDGRMLYWLEVIKI